MKENKLSFEFKGLTVDWISLSIKGSLNVKPIADYLFQILGFNSTIGKRIEGKLNLKKKFEWPKTKVSKKYNHRSSLLDNINR